MSNFDFNDLTPREVTGIRIGDKTYTLREATEGAAVVYRNAQLRATKLQGGKVVGVDGLADTEPLLVSLCLFEDGDKPVPVNVVKCWPSRLVKKLFDKAQEMSDLKEEQDANARLLKRALTLPDAPTAYAELLAWAKHLDEQDPDTYGALHTFLQDDASREESLKNG